MGRFVGKMLIGGRLLDEMIGGTIRHASPDSGRASGQVALPHAIEQLARSAKGPIHLITEGGPMFRVDLGRSQVVGELYVLFDFVGTVADSHHLPIFSILAYPDLRAEAAGEPDAGPADDDADEPVVLAFTPAERTRRRAGSE
ncbi:hypothetical protein TA3x_003616 [Tundrisphaera sp. TA3]|uniref:hypothetical protein n=1 Tax=Tundrisphaera sp. TA3 TaxID=3435775 RepID=UPI003EBB99C0